jgi:co-chaperonin GroES (HSP10)
MLMNWEPRHDRLFVKRCAEPERGRIVIPEKYQQPTHTGFVLSVGPEVLDVRPGDIVTFGRFTDHDEDGVVLIQEADVMFKVSKPVKIGIEAFTHNAVGVDRFAGSLEDRYEKTAHG